MWCSMCGEEILKTLHLKDETGESLENYPERKKPVLEVIYYVILFI